MPDELLSHRVERLEKSVEALQTLPADVAALGERVAAVETQILRLGTEMRGEFSAVRSEMRGEFAAVRSEMQTEFAAVRAEMQSSLAICKVELRQEIRDDMLVGLANVTSELGRQIQESAEEGRRHSRMLFEEALGRIAVLSEHRDASPGRKAPTRRKR